MLTRLIIMGLVPMLILLAIDKGGNTMAMTKQPEVLNTSIPPIDIGKPVETETATFALG